MQAFKSQTKYQTVRAYALDNQKMEDNADKNCGNTNPVTPMPLPETYVQWTHSSNEGFTPSHHGPCEVWCDDERAFFDENCAKNYNTVPNASLPFERSKCVGKKMLHFWWLALHDGSNWQVYINCVKLAGSSDASPGASTPASSPYTSTAAYASTSPLTTSPSNAALSQSPQSSPPGHTVATSASATYRRRLATPSPTTCKLSAPTPTASPRPHSSLNQTANRVASCMLLLAASRATPVPTKPQVRNATGSGATDMVAATTKHPSSPPNSTALANPTAAPTKCASSTPKSTAVATPTPAPTKDASVRAY
ncbi:TPA: hypothetical protein N0F65_004019 [Lagenidium giganteum]|uniref:Chitin-binding type-4 domain-containing protein n=1 Tax=Lagenidium giganteum TaxID=4803 RepID=A0AAV2YX80_9STRA|nr:TPA: hypothetical protein N0F65_004019 [Lagenidium giganteum]